MELIEKYFSLKIDWKEKINIQNKMNGKIWLIGFINHWKNLEIILIPI